MSSINKKELEHLADLARLELSEKENEKFLADLEKILDHFQELQGLNTDNVQPVAGGTQLKNALRQDAPFKENHYAQAYKIVEQFPSKTADGHLETPPVFE